MPSEIKSLPRNTWVKVLDGATFLGMVAVIPQDEQDPTDHKVTWVASGGSAPAADFNGGVSVPYAFKPANTVAQDYYMKAVDFDGEAVVYT